VTSQEKRSAGSAFPIGVTSGAGNTSGIQAGSRQPGLEVGPTPRPSPAAKPVAYSSLWHSLSRAERYPCEARLVNYECSLQDAAKRRRDEDVVNSLSAPWILVFSWGCGVRQPGFGSRAGLPKRLRGQHDHRRKDAKSPVPYSEAVAKEAEHPASLPDLPRMDGQNTGVPLRADVAASCRLGPKDIQAYTAGSEWIIKWYWPSGMAKNS